MSIKEEVKVVRKITSTRCEIYVCGRLIDVWRRDEEVASYDVLAGIMGSLKIIGYKVVSYQTSPDGSSEFVLRIGDQETEEELER